MEMRVKQIEMPLHLTQVLLLLSADTATKILMATKGKSINERTEKEESIEGR